MTARLIQWIIGGVALLLYARVGYFAFASLGPQLGCALGPEIRFWGYGADVFAHCFDPVPENMMMDYEAVLLGWDRLLALALAAFLALWSIRAGIWIGVGAAVGYGLSDWFENDYLVSALAGDTAAIGMASLLTTSKFACLALTIGAHLWAARHNRSDI